LPILNSGELTSVGQNEPNSIDLNLVVLNLVELIKLKPVDLISSKSDESNSYNLAYPNFAGMKWIELAEPILLELNSAKQVVRILPKSHLVEPVLTTLLDCMLIPVWLMLKLHYLGSVSLYTHALLK